MSSKSGLITPHLQFTPFLFEKVIQQNKTIRKNLCDNLSFVPLTQRSQPSTMFIPKNSPFKEHFNIA